VALALALGVMPFALPSIASAATVSVSKLPGNTNVALLEFQADPGESNRVTISIEPYTGPMYGTPWTEPTYRVQIVDKGAAIKAGANCTSPEVVGAMAGCSMPATRGPQYESCGFKCTQAIPGTAWEGRMVIGLGDGDNSLDASALPLESDGESIEVIVSSGDGDDSITTAAGKDRIDPGAGADEIHAGRSDDHVEATSAPDGPDVYDLGEGAIDQVSYRRRSDPVYLSGDTAGNAGENDRLVDVEMVAGGSAADVLTGGPAYRLVGNAGNDRITGTNGKDLIAGGEGNDILVGGGDFDNITGDLGNDLLDGGDGNDTLADHIDWLSSPGEAGGGNDVAFGDSDGDRIELGSGDDRAGGGEGNDLLYGSGGDDKLSGGDGKDAVIGEGGSDQLLGGAGPDHLFASRSPQPLYTDALQPLDYASDRVNCGPGEDHAKVNPWDSVKVNRWDQENRCETVRSSPRFKLRRERLQLKGATVLTAVISAPGWVSLSGPGVEQVKRIARFEVPDNHQARHVVRLPVRPKGSALAMLLSRGQIRVPVTVRLHVSGGVDQVRMTHVTITLRS
jgi:Ca2+-binding RTX toxin-like protein